MNRSRIMRWIAIAGAIVIAAAVVALLPALDVAAGYSAKVLCSSVFVTGEDPAWVMDNRIRFALAPAGEFVSEHIDQTERRVHVSLFGRSATALHRPGLGCTLVRGLDEDAILAQVPASAPTSTARPQRAWPEGNVVSKRTRADDGIDREALARVLDEAFREPDPAHPKLRGTLAVLVVHDGALIAERYATTHHAGMRMPSWSMGKSIANALYGVLVRTRGLDLHSPAPVATWQRAADDPRAAITLDQLLRMSSGLEFSETYTPGDDSTQMLFREADTGGYAAERPAVHGPDTHWSYSSGTTNLLAKVLREQLGGTTEAVRDFARREIFDRIGMKSVVLEPDASGTFILSSFAYATPHDWARFGQLYLDDGIWEGERILPEGWVAYSTTPTPAAPRGEYGAQFWLNSGRPSDPTDRQWPSVSRDMYSATGHQGQFVSVVPSKQLVIVRLGIARDYHQSGLEELVAGVAALVP